MIEKIAQSVTERPQEGLSGKMPDFSVLKEKLPGRMPDFDKQNLSKKMLDLSDGKENIKKISTRNEDLNGKQHPETGVPFEEKTVETNTGEKVTGVFPEFVSKFNAHLPEELHEASDKEQFDECNKQLKQWCEENPEEAQKKFTPEQLEDIKNGDTPEGYTWHHNEEKGKMQLVDSETHAKTGHTGGKVIWGGGNDNR